MTRILWVEDQSHWIDKFKSTLQTTALTGPGDKTDLSVFRFAEAACEHIKLTQTPPDIAILDANMNGNDHAGFIVSRVLKKKWPAVPIIYLSEHSGTGIEQQAFEQTNAQDFISKHQQNIESVLIWRIKAILRHQKILHSDETSAVDCLLSGRLKIDLVSWNVYWHDVRLMNPKNPVRPLAPTPRKILGQLVEAAPRPLTALQIADKLDLENFNYPNYRQQIKILRQAFEYATQCNDLPSFIDQCQNGHGIVTFGDQQAYCWVSH